MAKVSKITTLAGDHTHQTAIPGIATAATEDEFAVFHNKLGRTIKVTGAGFIPDETITGAATNNLTLQFQNKGILGTGTTGITAIKTYASGTNANKFVEDALTLSTTVADLLVVDGAVISLNKANNGTGLALPAGVAVLRFEYQ